MKKIIIVGAMSVVLAFFVILIAIALLAVPADALTINNHPVGDERVPITRPEKKATSQANWDLDFYPGWAWFSSPVQEGQGGYIVARALWGEKWQWGFFLHGAMGSGETVSGYNYDYEQFSLGPQLRYRGKGWESDFAVGPWWHGAEGEIGNYKNSQSDKGLYAFSTTTVDQRRRDGETVFPEIKFFLSGVVATSTDYEEARDGQIITGGEAYENSRFGGRVTFSVYDMYMGKGMRVTPLVQLGFESRDSIVYSEYGAGFDLRLAKGKKITILGRNKDDPKTEDDRFYISVAGNIEF